MLERGASILHVIYLDPDVATIPVRRLQNTLDTLAKMFTIMFATVANEDIDHAREINLGLDLLARIARGETLSQPQVQSLVRFMGWLRNLPHPVPYRKLTIHRYRPLCELGGALGMLNFGRDIVVSSIEQGFTDAVNHDCVKNNCVLPEEDEN